jgi:hypothetical protein
MNEKLKEMTEDELYAFIKCERYDLYGMADVYDEETIKSCSEYIKQLELILAKKIRKRHEKEFEEMFGVAVEEAEMECKRKELIKDSLNI